MMMDLFLTNTQLLASQDINWWTGVLWITCGLLWCFYQMFGLSFWRHPFTAEDSLVSKWWNATFLQICSHEEINSSTFTSWMAWGWGHFQPITLCLIERRKYEWNLHCDFSFLWVVSSWSNAVDWWISTLFDCQHMEHVLKTNVPEGHRGDSRLYHPFAV